VEPPPWRKPQSRRTNKNDQQSAAASSSRSSRSSSIYNNITNAPTVRNITNVPLTTVVISSTVPTTSSNIACAIHECAEYTSTICNDCLNSERCYLYCSLHVMHTSHANKSAPRRINTSNIVAKNNNTNTPIQA
jgi:hypothetical protein